MSEASLAGLAYPRLVPSSLLPPEDPSHPEPRRTLRDWVVDVLAVLISAAFGVLAYSGSISSAVHHVPDWQQVADWVGSIASVVAIWWRRRHPVGVALLTALVSAFAGGAAAASAVGLFTVTVHRRSSVAVAFGALNIAVSAVFMVYRPQKEDWWVTMLISLIAVVVVVAWGMFVRARRQLIWTLRARAERAETEQRILAEQARRAERTRIAREMHDVLAHRISLIALHAGGLQVRPDLPPEQVQETAELLRSTAHRALEELRGVIGVLRDGDPDDAPAQPQPTLQDIPRLVDETRRAGAKIDFSMAVPADVPPPDALGRDAYRIVQEALTNVAKHARGTATSVSVSGGPGDGLRVDVRNRLPIGRPEAAIPGSGSGLLGLQERVTLAGGTLAHGPNGQGEFVVDARLTWL